MGDIKQMNNSAWLRPKTNKVYLQRPLSERIALLSPDFKVLSLPLLDNGTHVGQPGVGVIFLHGKDMSGFDLDKTSFRTIEHGLPIYEVINRQECLTKLEAFSGEERNPTVYFKVTLENDTEKEISGDIGVMPRSGQEKYMLNQHQEGYSPYRPNWKNWCMIKRTWSLNSEHAKSDMGYLKLNSNGISAEWVSDSPSGEWFSASDYFKLSYTLLPGETKVFTGALRAKEPISDFSYDEKREETVTFWKNELEKIKNHPKIHKDVYLHMAMQCLQMLARYEGSDRVAVRQGDIGRFIWPYEGSQVLVNLDRAGLSEHTGDVYRWYFDRWLVKEGSDIGRIKDTSGWDNATGSVIWGASEHLKMTKDRAEFEEFLPYLIMMRDWIQKKCDEPREFGYNGIFPSGQGSDWSERGQFWTFTDSHNCMALRSMCEALKHFESSEYEKTKAMYDDYSAAIKAIRDELHSGHEQDEMFIFPHMLGIQFEDSENYSYYTDGAPYLLYTGFIAPGSTMQKQMEAFFRKRGQFQNGLTGRMTSCASMWDEAYFGGYGDVWYTMQSETYWIKAWLAAGETDKALETLSACLTYAMTTECIVSERYCSINPWYSPWQPNGSGCSRMMEILLSF